MAFLDAFARLLVTILKLLLWMVAGLLGLVVLSLGLALLLGWMVLNRLRGRRTPVDLDVRLASLRQFGQAFRPGRAGGWPPKSVDPAQPDPHNVASPLARRVDRSGPVEDVQARDLPPDPPRH